jgi:molybdopterin/thiamine biosynthesis adenylyltransferase
LGFVRCLPLLERGATIDELNACWVNHSELKAMLDLLRRLRLVVPATEQTWKGTVVERQVSYLAALGLDGDGCQRRLQNRHVAVFGAGGIGCVVLDHLARAGIGTFSVIDHDSVQMNNLNRQSLYSVSDLNHPKTAAAAKALSSRNPHCKIGEHRALVQHSDDLLRLMNGRWDCLVVAADSPPDRIDEIAASFCERSGVPVISGRCGLRVGSWGPLLRAPQVAARCEQVVNSRHEQHGLPPPANAVMTASFGPTNSVIGSFLARDIILFLLGEPVCSELCVITIDFDRLIFSMSSLGTRPAT